MTINKTIFRKLHSFLLFWLTQSLSALGSAATGYALIIWSYTQEGSALSSALLAVCSYLPYVLFSLFAGAVCDRFNKKWLILICDSIAALSSLLVLVLLLTGRLAVYHLYLLNALNGLASTVQQPSTEVLYSLLVPREYYPQTSGLRSLSNAIVTLLTPVVATAILTFFGLRWVILLDLTTFILAFCTLKWFVKVPAEPIPERTESFLSSARAGIGYLKANRGILDLMLFLAAINFTASVYNAALPALVIPRAGEAALGVVNTVAGLAMLIGGGAAVVLPAPRSRVRVIYAMLLFSMGTENFMLAFGGGLVVWCIGAVFGWIGIPLMSANMDVLLREQIPAEMRGRVYSARNSLQFFTIPLGYFTGGILVDRVFEPAMISPPAIFQRLFGNGKGSGAALLFALLGIAGTLTCLVFMCDRNIHSLEKPKSSEKTQQYR